MRIWRPYWRSRKGGAGSQMMMQEEIKEGYYRFQTITVLDDETIKAARANFGRFRMKGVIFGGRYDDDAWHL